MMSYEYKDTIQDSIIHYYDHVILYNEYTDDVLEELDHVYTQAAKVDEFKAKAEAYDDIRYAMEMQTAIGVSDEDTLIDIHHVIMRFIERRESGEPNAEK